jgi:hypothetical protein
MESTSEPNRAEASALLSDADTTRARLVNSMVVPSFFYSSIGIAIAAQIATASVAIGIGSADSASRANWLLPAGLVFFALVVAIQLARFQRLNGLRLDGLTHRVLGGTAAAASTSYAIALGAAIWAAFEGVWWLVAVCSVAGGLAYAVAGRCWMRNYRIDPTEHGRAYSHRWLAVVGLLAVVGFLLLTIGH